MLCRRFRWTLKECYKANDLIRLPSEAQIANIKGLILLRSANNSETLKDLRATAKEAFTDRIKLIEQFPEGSKERYEQNYLLSNIWTALLDHLVNIDKPTQAYKHELLQRKEVTCIATPHLIKQPSKKLRDYR